MTFLGHRNIFILTVGLLLTVSCTESLDDPVQDNPLDPGNPEYIPPSTTILSGPEEGDTLNTPDATFRWRGSLSNSDYSYRLNDSDWSDWSMDSSVSFRLLDELTHMFEVRTRYGSGDTEEPPTSISFTVNAVSGPAYMIQPRLIQVVVGEEFSLELMAEEVTDFAIAEVNFAWDHAVVELIGISIYTDSTAFLKSNGGTIINFVDIDTATGSAVINVGVAAGDPDHVEGTGALFRIRMKAIDSGNTEVQVLESSSMRNGSNTHITINKMVNGVVEVR